MREILFRGKRKDNEEWIIGYYSYANDGHGTELHMISEKSTRLRYPVIPETVGQYTGLIDKNGKKIFEGDVVDVAYKVDYVGVSKYRIGVFKVISHNGCFMKKAIPDPQLSFNDNAQRSGLYHFIPSDETEVVGNVFDNSEYGGGAE